MKYREACRKSPHVTIIGRHERMEAKVWVNWPIRSKACHRLNADVRVHRVELLNRPQALPIARPDNAVRILFSWMI